MFKTQAVINDVSIYKELKVKAQSSKGTFGLILIGGGQIRQSIIVNCGIDSMTECTIPLNSLRGTVHDIKFVGEEAGNTVVVNTLTFIPK